MSWKLTNYDGTTFGSIIKQNGNIYILLYDHSLISLNTDYHQFIPVPNRINRSQEIEVWEFDEPINTTSVLKLIQKMVL